MNIFENHLRQHDKRRETRYAVHVPVFTQEGEGIQEHMLNYSTGGCCISSPVVYRENDVLALTIPVWPQTDRPTFRIGRVVWRTVQKGGPGRYGIQFCAHKDG